MAVLTDSDGVRPIVLVVVLLFLSGGLYLAEGSPWTTVKRFSRRSAGPTSASSREVRVFAAAASGGPAVESDNALDALLSTDAATVRELMGPSAAGRSDGEHDDGQVAGRRPATGRGTARSGAGDGHVNATPASQRGARGLAGDDGAPSDTPYRPGDELALRTPALMKSVEGKECRALRDCVFRCEPDDNPAVPCFDGCLCPGPVCIVSRLGKCVPNPFYVRRPSAATEREGVCLPPNAPPIVSPSDPSSSRDGRPAHHTGDPTRHTATGDPLPTGDGDDVDGVSPSLHQFQRETGWLFQRWFRFGGTCVRDQDVENGGKITGGHDANGVFRLRNVCVRSNGQLAGFRPPKDGIAFRGKLEVEVPGFLTDTMSEARVWLQHPRPLPEVPSCFIDTNAVLFPALFKSDNHQHVLHRLASMMKLIEEEFGGDEPHAPDEADGGDVVSAGSPRGGWRNVTAIYAPFRGALDELTGYNAYSYFYQMITGSWASIFPIPPTKATMDELWRFGPKPPPTLHRRPAELCFREVLVPYSCLDKCVWGDGSPKTERRIQDSMEGRARRFLYTWNGQRTRADREHVHRLRQRFASCFGGRVRKAPNRTHPRIVIHVRSLNRRHTGLPNLTLPLAEYATRVLGARSLDVVEHVRLTPAAAARLFFDTDIMLGHIGGALTWSFLMPPGSAVAEFSRVFGCSSSARGWNAASKCDYGGTALAAGVHHLSLNIPPALSRVDGSAKGPANMFYVGLGVYKQVLAALVCALRLPSGANLKEECPPPAEWAWPADFPPGMIN